MDKRKLETSVFFKLPTFLEQITYLISEREDNSISTELLQAQIEFMISNNLGNSFIQFVNCNLKLTIDKCIVFVLAYYRLRRQFSCDFETLISSIFDDFSEQTEYLQNLSSGNNDLIRRNIARFQESSFVNDRNLGLTARTIEVLYKQFPELSLLEDSEESLIKSKAIISKRLYYENDLKKQVDSLTNILINRNFTHFQARLQEHNLPRGITAIFFGQPGTGKTETAFQIAKKTNRDILMVDLSQLKSKWFGESEKKVKGIFDDYRRYFNNTIIKPILFINEADGMFSKRTEISAKGSSTDQTMNTIQNIILQELENFEGILFATTNLTENLDNAFERRFLFKIEFKNPLPEIREKIWKEKLPELKPVQARDISLKYQLSGGEIENVARKYIIEKVIEKKQLSLDRLMEFCELEKPFQKHKRIGFQV
jgi:SpoVK/Ycf46/Vps4 family AAA+-type ATPase